MTSPCKLHVLEADTVIARRLTPLHISTRTRYAAGAGESQEAGPPELRCSLDPIQVSGEMNLTFSHQMLDKSLLVVRHCAGHRSWAWGMSLMACVLWRQALWRTVSQNTQVDYGTGPGRRQVASVMHRFIHRILLKTLFSWALKVWWWARPAYLSPESVLVGVPIVGE